MSTEERVIIRGSRESFRKYAPAEVFDKITEISTIPELLERCEAYAEHEAVQYNGEAFTYAQLLKDTAAFRGALAQRGLKEGDRVLLHLANSYNLIVAFLAAASAGCSAAIAPAQLPVQAIEGLVKMFGCRAVVGPESDQAITCVPCMTGSEREEPVPAADVKGTDECVIMFTGGTTGRSKGAVLNHRAVLQGVINGCYGYKDVFDQRYILALPMSHVFGLIRGTLAAFYTGSSLFICLSPQAMFRDAATFRPTMWIAVPALADMALSLSKKFGRMMLGPDMRTIICGAAAVPPYLISEFSKYGISLFPGYGLTESANLVSGNPEFAAKPTSVGLPFPNQELCLEDGELLLRGDNMLTAYIGTPEKAYDADGWFHTGDLARFDEDGLLYITGRIKEIIVLENGENVSPAEVEAYFNELPAVQDSQLFEDVNENGITILALEVVPRATELNGVTDVNAFLMPQLEEVNRNLPSHCRASRIVIRDTDFERSPSMKILRYKKK